MYSIMSDTPKTPSEIQETQAEEADRKLGEAPPEAKLHYGETSTTARSG